MVFPQTETSPDPGALRAFVEAAEGLGYAHIVLYDHVLGAAADRPGGWRGPYSEKDPFHEVFVVMGFMAAITSRIELVTEVLVLPQRQAALVAKQAAEVDMLSRGRLRLGVGIGWNRVEYEALGEDFRTRGRRVEEQVELIRRLLADPVVDFKGEFHSVSMAGLNPLPGRRIPIWMGGTSDPAKRRIARIADGWMMDATMEADPRAALVNMHDLVAEAGRNHADFGVDMRFGIAGGPEKTAEAMAEWHQLGITHATINPMGAGLTWPSGHIDALGRFTRVRRAG